MAEIEPTNPVLSYASSESLPTRQSRYSHASLAVSSVAILWLILMVFGILLPFDVYKQYRIGTVASVLALILAIAAYRQPHRKRSLAHTAITLAGVTFFAYVLLVPL